VKSVWTTPTAVVPNRTGHGVTVIINALTRTERQVWIGVDRPGRVVTRNAGPITFLSAAARREWIRAGGTRPMTGVNGPLPANAFVWPAGVAGRPNRATAYQQLLALPTNVDALWRVIYRGAGQGSAAWKRHEMFTEIGDLLREDPIPAKVRAALYRVAARIPGIQLLGLTRDALGRPALAVSLNDVLYGMRDELLFDPRTAALLGEASVVVKPPPTYHVKPGSVRSGATYVMSGIVERIGQVPAR
jgi:hypothetical protein